MSAYGPRIAAKEALIREAEALARTTDFRGGHRRAQNQLRRWKALGHGGPGESDLWRRFKSAHDTFYARKPTSNAAIPPRRRGPYDRHSFSQLLDMKRDQHQRLRHLKEKKRAYERLNRGMSFWNNEGYKEIEEEEKRAWERIAAIDRELTARQAAQRR